MPRPKGLPRTGGRKAGTPNTLPRLRKLAVDILNEKGLNPAEELLKLLPQANVSEQVRIWELLLSYCEPKRQGSDAINILINSGTEEREVIEIETDDLLKLVNSKEQK